MSKTEKTLIGIALFLLAIIVGYNAFFIPEVPLEVEMRGGISYNDIKDELGDKTKSMGGKVNINTANKDELIDSLKGVGPSIAKKIVAYREKVGKFESIEEIKNIKGIGDALFLKLKDYIKV